MLIDYGTGIYAIDEHGQNALYVAESQATVHVLTKTASVYAATKSGDTPFRQAVSKRFTEDELAFIVMLRFMRLQRMGQHPYIRRCLSWALNAD